MYHRDITVSLASRCYERYILLVEYLSTKATMLRIMH
jgi:hypothetical protein